MDISKTLKSEEPRICEICSADFSKYTCPKCGINYCSVNCYKDVKKHIQCSESFYRDCIVESMKADGHNVGSNSSSGHSGATGGGNPVATCSKEMSDILERIRNGQEDTERLLFDDEHEDEETSEESESSLDSDDDESLRQRMQGIDLDDSTAVWNKLTLEEKKGFQKFVKEYNEKFNVDEGGADEDSPPLVQELVDNSS